MLHLWNEASNTLQSYGLELNESMSVEGLAQSKCSIKGHDDGTDAYDGGNDREEGNDSLHEGNTIWGEFLLLRN